MCVDDFGDVAAAGAVGDLGVHAGAVVVHADHGDFEPLVAGNLAQSGQAVNRGAAAR